MTTNSTTDGQANQLRKNSLGVAAVTFLVVSAAAPLTAVAGGVPLSMLLGNGAGIPATFILVTVLLLLFAVGYVAMSRHVRNAGAFYAYTTRGLGGVAGGAAAIIAIVSYNCMQIGVFGLFGAATSGLLAGWGINLPWWVWCYVGIALVAVLGYRRVDISAKVLTVLVVLEYLVVLILDFAIIGQGGDSGLSLAPFTPAQFFQGSPAIGILFCFAAFIGFEATTIYSEEAKEPVRTVPRATYISVLLIGVFYMFTSWLMANGAGVDKLVGEIGGLADPTTFLFTLSDRYVGGWLTQLMSILFVTSLFAGVTAFHNGVARYMYVAGREGLLPAGVGVTHRQFQSPHVASVIQTIIAVAVITLFAVTGQDPVLNLFSWLTNVGTLGIIVLMAATSFAVVAFFSRNAGLEPNALKAWILPVVSGLAFLVVIFQIVINFGNLSGASGFLGWFLPSIVLIAAIVGAILAVGLKSRSNAAFEALGSARY
ncbi:amino acid permease [Youhaiella tibetensis]|uniref:APC family permease n=1 Tax=Paradevosia tibetensis TaxID=1447062 RepID=A0A5B9DLW8_9HYPH|nr:APC family permease [Youhaiella tibetensis]AKR54917.1 amino acid permease [Devosia sp. H5989]QEE20026.1 APC family permease [Youhaiella tibetensis]GGF27756.1 amino acid permease [Youhaiella tibetensis]